MHIAIECGACGTPITVPNELAGRKIRCRSCGTMLVVPAMDDQPAPIAERPAPPRPDDYDQPPLRRRPREDDDRRPRRRRFREKGGDKTWLVVLGIIGGVVLLVVVGGLVYLLVTGGNVLTGDNGNLSAENGQRFNDRFRQGNMTLDEAEEIFGASRRATEADVRQVNEGAPPGVWILLPRRAGQTMYRWKERNQWIFVTVDDRTRIIVMSQGHRKGN
jgi:hypothetical protein